MLPAGIFIGANGRKQRCNTGADILSHNDRDSGAIGDLPRAGQRLKDTHRCRAGLDNASEHRADQNTQIGLENMRKISRNCGTFLRLETAEDMASMPNMSVAKPRRIIPVSFFLSALQNIYK